jgi:hypothetical protein
MIELFGIRHHGPGCARSLVAALEAMQPDIVLIEGPPEGDALLPLAASAEMQPPVALMVYAPDKAGYTAVFPFAAYSPEWQAIQYTLKHEIPARFMDLPQRNWLAMKKRESRIENQESTNQRGNRASLDPLDLLAHAAGLEDGEQWWEKVVEERGGDAKVFPAILEAMTVVRETIRAENPDPRDPLEPQREAAMRMNIRQAQKDGFARGVARARAGGYAYADLRPRFAQGIAAPQSGGDMGSVEL